MCLGTIIPNFTIVSVIVNVLKHYACVMTAATTTARATARAAATASATTTDAAHDGQRTTAHAAGSAFVVLCALWRREGANHAARGGSTAPTKDPRGLPPGA